MNYGCDAWELEEQCVDSAWGTEGGAPYAAFYPREKLEDLWPNTTDELRIEATPELTNFDSEGNEKNVSLETLPAPRLPCFLSDTRSMRCL